MKITRMHKGSYGKIRAFFDVETDEGITVKGFKLIEGSDGAWVANPSSKGSDGEYYDLVFVKKELRNTLRDMAVNYYKGESGETQETPQETTQKREERITTEMFRDMQVFRSDQSSDRC